MDLWLRLQNKKTLIKVNSEISTNGYGRIFVNGDNKIATYKTEERALEVLDEIQKLLEDRICFENYISLNIVYEMPLE